MCMQKSTFCIESGWHSRRKLERGRGMQNRIRKAEQMKIPYMLVVGNEEEQGTVAVSKRNKNEAKIGKKISDVTLEY